MNKILKALSFILGFFGNMLKMFLNPLTATFFFLNFITLVVIESVTDITDVYILISIVLSYVLVMLYRKAKKDKKEEMVTPTKKLLKG